MVMFAEQCKCTSCHSSIYLKMFKMVNSFIYMYHNFKKYIFLNGIIQNTLNYNNYYYNCVMINGMFRWTVDLSRHHGRHFLILQIRDYQ